MFDAAPETITELALRWKLEDEHEAFCIARAHKIDALRRAGIRFDVALVFFEQFAPRAA